MKTEFYLRYEQGLPRATAQEKGETIKYKYETILKFWNDDNQVVDLRVVKYYSEKGTIFIRMEELENEQEQQ